jgi:hypothetical protein
MLEEGVLPAVIAPNGQAILGVTREKKWQWYPVAGGAPRPAPGLTVDDTPGGIVGWSADASALFVRNGTDVPARVDRVEVATGRRTLLKEMGPADRAGLFIFDPLSVSKDGAQYAYRYSKRLSTLFVVSPSR